MTSRRAGFTLPECLLAVLLVASTAVIVITLLEMSMRYATWTDQQAVAAMLVQKRVNIIRDWKDSQVGGVYNFYGSWASMEGTFTDPNYPAYTITVAPTSWSVQYSPSTQLESVFAPNQRTMIESMRLVPVSVSNGAVLHATSVTVNALIEAPRQAFNNLVISNVSVTNPLPQGSSDSFAVQAYDGNGQPIYDLFYRWYIKPLTSNGMLTSTDRSGRIVSFTNQFMLGDGTITYTGAGTVQLQVRTMYMGVEYWQTSAVITLL